MHNCKRALNSIQRIALLSQDTCSSHDTYIARNQVLPLVVDTVDLINTGYEEGRRVLVEGGQATMLDIDFGTYPFVTSSNPTS